MRDIVFLVADGEMEETVKGFFENPAYERRLQCNRFSFDPQQDVYAHPGKDPGVYAGAHNFLELYLDSHKYAVVMLDFAFNDNLINGDIDSLKEDISQNMLSVGWPEERFHIMVINPELEVLMWQEDTRKLEEILDYRWEVGSLRNWLRDKGLWDEGEPKPSDPKSAIDIIRAANPGRTRTHSQIFRRVAKDVSFIRCRDQAFIGLWQQLQHWYPVQYV